MRFGAVLAAVFRDAVQRVDAHIKQVAIVVNQADGLLRLDVVLDGFEAVEAPDAVVDVGPLVAGLHFVEVFQRDGLLGREVVAEVETVVTLKDLVVGVAAHFQILVDEAAVDSDGLGFEVAVKLVIVVDVVQNCLNARKLLATLGKDDDAVAFLLVFGDVVDEEVEVFAEDGLGLGVEGNS